MVFLFSNVILIEIYAHAQFIFAGYDRVVYQNFLIRIKPLMLVAVVYLYLTML